MPGDHFETAIARLIWESRYRYHDAAGRGERSVEESWRRVARSVAAVERAHPEGWCERFLGLLRGFRFLPGGRILAGAGTGRQVTLFNCFVMGQIEDSMDGIFDALKEGALTMQQGGGVGYDFSTLRPAGTRARHAGTIASGPLSFMRIWDSMCATILSTGARRGAMMATLRCDHPDIERFVAAKRRPGELRHFNLSVQVSDAFMEAVEADAEWPLIFPDSTLEGGGAGESIARWWPGHDGPVPCRIFRRIPARRLWRQIMRACYDYAEPGVLFVDSVNRLNNLWYREMLTATNPCGELPLPPYGACDLGSINLTRFVHAPFGRGARFDLDGMAEAAALAVRLMDNVIDLSRFPLPAQAAQVRGNRRIGLGITGLADALILLGLRYDGAAGRAAAADAMRTICHAAYRASIRLAQEKGPFPWFRREAYLQGVFIRNLPDDIRDGIAAYGIRNSHLTAIAPTGTVSLLANNVSSGLEPLFDYRYRRHLLQRDGSHREEVVTDYAWRRWRELRGDAPLPESFIRAQEIPPEGHLQMQAALQPFVDSAISKTITIPETCRFEQFEAIYRRAWELGLKGCTTFRPNPVTGAVLEGAPPEAAACPRCDPAREPD